MSIFDDIKRDRETGSMGAHTACAHHNELNKQVIIHGPDVVAADIRRRARVDKLEAIALAAEELASAVEATNAAVSDWADTYPFDDEDGEAASQAAERVLRDFESKQLIALSAFREACK